MVVVIEEALRRSRDPQMKTYRYRLTDIESSGEDQGSNETFSPIDQRLNDSWAYEVPVRARHFYVALFDR
jgi:hypothetical protein